MTPEALSQIIEKHGLPTLIIIVLFLLLFLVLNMMKSQTEAIRENTKTLVELINQTAAWKSSVVIMLTTLVSAHPHPNEEMIELLKKAVSLQDPKNGESPQATEAAVSQVKGV